VVRGKKRRKKEKKFVQRMNQGRGLQGRQVDVHLGLSCSGHCDFRCF
jgi:hypothetical protein